MFTPIKTAQETLAEIKSTKPPYCPNPHCACHDPEISKTLGRYVRNGTKPINRFPHRSVTFKCKHCGKLFPSSIFTFSYRDKLDDNYADIMGLRGMGGTWRDIAEVLKCDLRTVLRRKRKIARQALLTQVSKLGALKIQESIAMDGIENFSYSQYDPNNVNHAVGRDTLFCYDFNFAPMNRKGVMSERQVIRKKQLENLHGKYDGRAIEKTSEKLFRRLFQKSEGELSLHTDNHFMYRSALKRLRSDFTFNHVITLAKVTRNFRNSLFAINHMDSLTRQKVASFKRETLSFAKHSIGMLEDFAIFMVHKNFMRMKFLRAHKSDPTSNKKTPAMRLGIATKFLEFHELFPIRLTKHQVKLNEDWLAIFERKDPSSRRPICAYEGM